MAMPRHLVVLALVLLLPACATTGTAQTGAASVAASATSSSETETPVDDAVQAEASPHQHAAPPQPPVLPSPVAVPLDEASRAGLPRATVIASAHGETLHCEGVALAALLQATGAMPAGPLRGAQLGRYVQVDGRDGGRVLFALAEFDPALGNRTVVLADRCDGKPLDDDTGPLRMIVPGEARPARWVSQVEAITVIVAP